MAGKFLTDAEMDELESKSTRFISDDEMQALENAPIDLVPAPQTTKPIPSVYDAVLRGAGQGVSLGWDDELMGGLGAIDEFVRRGATKLSDVVGAKRITEDVPVEREDLPLLDAMKARYQRERDANRTDINAAREARPKTFLGAQLGGALLMPTPGAKGSAIQKALGLAGVGAISGAGGSEAKTAAGLGLDTAMGGAIGGGIGGLSAGLGVVGNKLGELAAKIRADKQAKVLGEFTSAAASEASAAGNAVQRVLSVVEKAKETLADSSATAEAKARAVKVLGDPEVMAHYEQALLNKLGDASSVASRAAEAKAAASAAATDLPGRAAQATEEYFTKNTPTNELTRRLGPLALRAGMGAAGGYLGSLAADAAGIDKGIGMAGGFGAGFSAPGTLQAMRNYAKSPAVQAGLLSKLQSAVQGGSQVAAATAPAAAQEFARGTAAGRDANADAINRLASRYGIDVGQLSSEDFFLGNGQPSGR